LFDDFEAQRGDLPGAASASVWLAIRQVVGELQRIEDSIVEEVQASESIRINRQAVMEDVMVALGGQATLKQLVAYVEQHPEDVEESEVLAKRLRRSGGSDFFAFKGKTRDGQAIYGLGECRPKGVRRQRRGFAARTHVTELACECLGPSRQHAEEASRDYARLQAWKATLSPTALLERVRRWKGARITSAKRLVAGKPTSTARENREVSESFISLKRFNMNDAVICNRRQ
ncbi:unnamed protein product, partial [Symbiodinium necroappetens]